MFTVSKLVQTFTHYNAGKVKYNQNVQYASVIYFIIRAISVVLNFIYTPITS